LTINNATGGRVWNPSARDKQRLEREANAAEENLRVEAIQALRYKRFIGAISLNLIAITACLFVVAKNGLPSVKSVADSSNLTITTSDVSSVPLVVLSALIAVLVCLLMNIKDDVRGETKIPAVLMTFSMGAILSFFAFSLYSAQAEANIGNNWLQNEVGTSLSFSSISNSNEGITAGFYDADNSAIIIEYTEHENKKILTVQPLTLTSAPEGE